MKIRKVAVEKQIQQVLLYIQEKLADIWKENILENLEAENLEYGTIEEFLEVLKKEFGGRDNKTMKIAELKKVKQEDRTIEEFMQEFKRVSKSSKYKERPLIKEFKQGMNRIIQ